MLLVLLITILFLSDNYYQAVYSPYQILDILIKKISQKILKGFKTISHKLCCNL